MTSLADHNEFAALSDSAAAGGSESKSWEGTARGLKDDAKEQAHQAKTQLKSGAAQLQEQIISGVSKGVQLAKEKAAQMTGKPELAQKSNDELLGEAEDAAQEGWEEVKRRGNRAVAKGQQQIDDTIDEKLTPAQRAKLNKGLRQAKASGARVQSRAEGLMGRVLSSPQLRPIRGFIERNNLQLPVLVLGAILSLWLSLSVIRLITTATAPAPPEFDIHSKEASMHWLKWHAGDYKDRAVDMKDSLSARAASFLANHDLDSMRAQAVDWKDIGMLKLGLSEPTWSEWLMSYVTGRPLTWQGRVLSVLDLAKKGISTSMSASKAAGNAQYNLAKGALKHTLGIHEPTLMERATNWVLGRDVSLQARAKAEAERQAASLSGRMSGTLESLKDSVTDGIENVKAHIPGTSAARAAAEEAAARAYAATHPSTLSKVSSGAEYIKNRIVHGAEEAAHRAEETAKRAVDEAKLKTGL